MHLQKKLYLPLTLSFLAVRYGRVPKRSRERSSDSSTVSTTVDPIELPASTVSSVTTSPLPLSSPVVVSPPVTPVEVEVKPNLAVYDIIVQVSQAHHANCAYTEDATRGLLRKSMIPLPQTVEDHEVRNINTGKYQYQSGESNFFVLGGEFDGRIIGDGEDMVVAAVGKQHDTKCTKSGRIC